MKPEEVKAIERAARFRMPWGKHRGEKLEDIESGYLRYLAEYSTDDEVCDKADTIYQYRGQTGEHF